MANMENLTKNKLTIEADYKQRSNRKYIFIFGVIVALATSFINIYLGLFSIFVTLVLWASQNGDEALRSGAVGEDNTISLLSRLPDTFTIYNQVDIPNSKSKTGFNEADVIVVGPEAVFVIEVKHNNGAIIGSEAEKEWSVNKVGRGGKPYSKMMRNPISQVKKLVWLLAEDMKKKKSKAWIQGVALFSNDKADVSIYQPTSIPVLRNGDLIRYLQSYKAKSKIANIRQVKQGISELKML